MDLMYSMKYHNSNEPLNVYTRNSKNYKKKATKGKMHSSMYSNRDEMPSQKRDVGELPQQSVVYQDPIAINSKAD